MAEEDEEFYCKSCFKPLKISLLRTYFEEKPILCDECTMDTSDYHVLKKFDMRIRFLNYYDGLMIDWLLKYKEQREVELAPCFLFRYSSMLKMLAKSYVIVPLPSSPAKVEERGFSHLNLMLDSYGIPYADALTKSSDDIQKEAGAADRGKKSTIVLRDEMKDSIYKKKILLFDDVFTTGSTLKASYNVIKEAGAKKIEAFVLMDNSSVEAYKLR